ncbi:MAG: T9SS type A sorting domain-containing protein [Saprospiraceae bacterium]
MNKGLLFASFFLLALPAVHAQNQLIGDGFGTNDWTTYDNFSASQSGTQILTTTATGTGNRYFRVAASGVQRSPSATCTAGNDTNINTKMEYTAANNNCQNGAWYYNVPNVTYQYVFKTPGATDNKFILFEIQGTIRNISSVSHAPTTIYAGQPVTVTATLDGAFSTGQSAYLRYSTDNFSNSTIVEMSGSGTTYTATIPGTANTGNANIKYYCFTSGNGFGTSIDHGKADWYTINLNNNGGANYAYTVGSTYGNTAATGACNGFWSDGDCWLNGSVPPSGVAITILENITMDVNPTVSSININVGKTLTSQSGSKTLTVNSGGTFACAGTFTANDGTVAFAASPGNCTVTGSPVFNNVTISGGGVDFGTTSTLNGTLTINAGGFVNSGTPTYGTGSLLKYNTGNYYGRRSEWDTKTPFNVQVSAGTQLDMGANGGTGTARTANGNLTVDGSSGFYLDYSSNDMTAAVTILGDVLNNGTISLSDNGGGDLKLGGHFTQNNSFNCKGRAVFFQGSANQVIAGTGNVLINYLFLNNAAGLTLNRNVSVDNELNITTGNISLGSYNLDLAAAVAVNVSGGAGLGKMVLADGTGMLRRYFSGAATFNYIIGSGGGAAGYTPVNLQVTSLGGAGYIGANVTEAKHPNNTSTTNYLERYWTVTRDGGVSSVGYNITCTYLSNDLVGTESSMKGGRWDGVDWQLLNQASGLSFSGSNLSDLSDFSGLDATPLPIELLDFRANSTGATVMLTWRTASERNNAYFDLERSTDGRTWAALGRVGGSGTTLQPQEYNFRDDQPLPGLNYYRLRQMDFDGAYAYSGIVVVNLGLATHAARFYPNPVVDELYLVLPIESEGTAFHARIYSLDGKRVPTPTLAGSRLDVSGLQPGVYLLKLEQEGKGIILVNKFVKR